MQKPRRRRGQRGERRRVRHPHALLPIPRQRCERGPDELREHLGVARREGFNRGERLRERGDGGGAHDRARVPRHSHAEGDDELQPRIVVSDGRASREERERVPPRAGTHRAADAGAHDGRDERRAGASSARRRRRAKQRRRLLHRRLRRRLARRHDSRHPLGTHIRVTHRRLDPLSSPGSSSPRRVPRVSVADPPPGVKVRPAGSPVGPIPVPPPPRGRARRIGIRGTAALAVQSVAVRGPPRRARVLTQLVLTHSLPRNLGDDPAGGGWSRQMLRLKFLWFARRMGRRGEEHGLVHRARRRESGDVWWVGARSVPFVVVAFHPEVSRSFQNSGRTRRTARAPGGGPADTTRLLVHSCVGTTLGTLGTLPLLANDGIHQLGERPLDIKRRSVRAPRRQPGA